MRKNPRTRHRNTIPKPVKVPANVPEYSESKSAPLCVPHSIDYLIPSSPMRVPVLPTAGSLRPAPMEVDADAETEVSIRLDGADRDEANALDLSPSLSDLSCFLGDSVLGEDYDGSSITVVDSEAYSHMQSTEDLYGWESELDRKVRCGIKNTNVCTCDEFEYRRANGTKRGLLHRVLNSGRRPL